MSRLIEATIAGELERNVDQLSERYFPGNHYRRSRYFKKALEEKVNRDLARLARAPKAKK